MGCSCSTPTDKNGTPPTTSHPLRCSPTPTNRLSSGHSEDFEVIDFVNIVCEPTPCTSRTNNPLSTVVEKLPDEYEEVQFSPAYRSIPESDDSGSIRKGTGYWSDVATRHSSFAIGSSVLSLQSGSTIHSVRLETHLRSSLSELSKEEPTAHLSCLGDGTDPALAPTAHNTLPQPVGATVGSFPPDTGSQTRLGSRGMTPTDAIEGHDHHTGGDRPHSIGSTGASFSFLTPICRTA